MSDFAYPLHEECGVFGIYDRAGTDVEGLLCAGVECRRDSASLQRDGGKEDECSGEKNAGGVEKLF